MQAQTAANQSIRTEPVKENIDLQYSVTVSRENVDGAEVDVYGIRLVKGGRYFEEARVDGVTSSKDAIASLVGMLRKYQVTPVVLRDVIEDYLVELNA